MLALAFIVSPYSNSRVPFPIVPAVLDTIRFDRAAFRPPLRTSKSIRHLYIFTLVLHSLDAAIDHFPFLARPLGNWLSNSRQSPRHPQLYKRVGGRNHYDGRIFRTSSLSEAHRGYGPPFVRTTGRRSSPAGCRSFQMPKSKLLLSLCNGCPEGLLHPQIKRRAYAISRLLKEPTHESPRYPGF